ncbi:PcfB family protein [Eubacteriales bacterium OttesenSCG-928-M02]|nr:PcfB family protein [Eubacteriales bacterium OttesenSCG-928-M02]
MNTGGEAADQIVRMSLNGVEVAAKITGAGAKHLAVLLYTILSQQKKTKGKTRLVSMLRSGKELKVFSVKNSDLKLFAKEARQYGILYCALKDKRDNPDGMTDIMVRAEDASKINRIVERFKFATVDTAAAQADIEKSRAEKMPDVPEQDVPEKSAEDKLMDELFEKPIQKEQSQQQNPSVAKTEKSPPSEPTSKQPRKSAEGTTRPQGRSSSNRPSVREELKDIKAAKSEKADVPRRENTSRSNPNRQNNAPKKSVKTKER